MKQWVQKLVSLLVQQPDWQLGLLMGLQSVQLSVKRLDLLSGLQTEMLWAFNLLMEQQLDSRLVLLLEATVADAVGLTVGIASVGGAVGEAVGAANGVADGTAVGPDVGAAVGLAVGLAVEVADGPSVGDAAVGVAVGGLHGKGDNDVILPD